MIRIICVQGVISIVLRVGCYLGSCSREGVQRYLMYINVMSKQSVYVRPTKGAYAHVLWMMSPNSGLAQDCFQ